MYLSTMRVDRLLLFAWLSRLSSYHGDVSEADSILHSYLRGIHKSERLLQKLRETAAAARFNIAANAPLIINLYVLIPQKMTQEMT
jgi:hypothetical protein